MSNYSPTTIVLRFRDLVTEGGATVAEHRRVIRQFGFVWWGWWYRQSEHIPKGVIGELFGEGKPPVPIILLNSGTLQLFTTRASQVVVAPSMLGVQSPQFEATPEYYFRGRYPLWFRFDTDILAIESAPLPIIGQPTMDPSKDMVPAESFDGEETALESLRDDRPTLWLSRTIQ